MKLHFFGKKSMSLKRFYRYVLITILLVILCFVLTAVCLTFISQKNKILTHTHSVLANIAEEYQGIEKNFWTLYMPIFENRDTYQKVYDYFSNQTDFEHSPINRKELHGVLHLMTNRDYRIAWIAFYSPLREENYVYVTSEDSLLKLDGESPIWNDLKSKNRPIELYGAKIASDIGLTFPTFSVGGGLPSEMGSGAILVGYPCSIFDQYAQASLVKSQTRYVITNKSRYIYDSLGFYSDSPSNVQNRGLRSILGTLDYALPPSGKHYVISFHVDKVSLYLKSNQYTPFIVTGGLILSLCAVFFYSLFSSRIFKQVQSIKSGLEKIGDNNLHYRLPEAAYSGELGSISRSINKMSSKLETLIENEYLYQLQQKEAELAELQAKFDPHFLYNSLEIIRGRVYDSGDTETADVIKKLSQLFRSFINKKRFVTIQDELAFCSSYFSLFHSPSSDNLQVVYDVDSSLLFCGIIRNLLQPVIENYFVHGFDPSSSQNHIIIRCAENGPEYIKITIIDDGFGINANRLEEIRAAMNASDDSGKQSYGLKNLARRIQLFYGPECGLSIGNNQERGVCVSLKIRRLSCEQHESLFQELSDVGAAHNQFPTI